MTTHGRGGLQRAWLGSVADQLVRSLTVPLLLIRPRTACREPRPSRHSKRSSFRSTALAAPRPRCRPPRPGDAVPRRSHAGAERRAGRDDDGPAHGVPVRHSTKRSRRSDAARRRTTWTTWRRPSPSLGVTARASHGAQRRTHSSGIRAAARGPKRRHDRPGDARPGWPAAPGAGQHRGQAGADGRAAGSGDQAWREVGVSRPAAGEQHRLDRRNRREAGRAHPRDLADHRHHRCLEAVALRGLRDRAQRGDRDPLIGRRGGLDACCGRVRDRARPRSDRR